MKSRIQLALLAALVSFFISSAQAAYTSLYVFGDCLSAATTNQPVGPYYYGDRWSNGRTWVEVLAQRMGLSFNLSGNVNAYFGNTSADLVSEANQFKVPADASNALVVIWVNNADMYYPATDSKPSLDKFNTVINQAQVNHYEAITTLYAKGIRTLIMPNVVDISTIPAFNNNPANASLFHQASLMYNAAFYATLDRARADCPGLKIYVPDFFALLQDLQANPDDYGVINATRNGVSIDALSALGAAGLSSTPGMNYIFWDSADPTAKVHYIMACFAQQLIAPVTIGKLTTLNGSNRLDLANLPVGSAGFVEESTNLTQGSWTLTTNFNATGSTQSLFVIAPPLPLGTNVYVGGGGPVNLDPNDTNNISTNPPVPLNSAAKFYRLRFPFNWNWP